MYVPHEILHLSVAQHMQYSCNLSRKACNTATKFFTLAALLFLLYVTWKGSTNSSGKYGTVLKMDDIKHA